MAVKTSGLDSRFALPGLTVMLCLFAFWYGTKRPSILADFPSSTAGAYVMTALCIFTSIWIGARNPGLFGNLPIVGEAAQ